jgi:hypothetical protein
MGRAMQNDTDTVNLLCSGLLAVLDLDTPDISLEILQTSIVVELGIPVLISPSNYPANVL